MTERKQSKVEEVKNNIDNIKSNNLGIINENPEENFDENLDENQLKYLMSVEIAGFALDSPEKDTCGPVIFLYECHRLSSAEKQTLVQI